ncbi:MAG: DHA2 family efflux MFS transporter permease subunit [Candidatus Limnocylindria bacterium]
MSSGIPVLSRAQRVTATAGVLLGLLMAGLDSTIVGTAMPRIVADLNGLASYAWVTTAYLVASTTVVPVSGRLGDLFGRKPFLIGGILGFMGASALCGLAQTMLELVLFRGLQGVFGGVLLSTVFAVIADLFPPTTRVKIQGLFSGTWTLSAIVGPTVGGLLADTLGWRWAFYVNVPLGLVALAVVLIGIPRVRSSASLRDVDMAGAAALAIGLVPLLVALSISGDRMTSVPLTGALVGIGVAGLFCFGLLERRHAHPIIPFGLFRNRTFAVAMIVGFFASVTMFGAALFVPLLYQGVLGVSATSSGPLLTPMQLGTFVAAVLSGQAMARIARYRLIGTAGLCSMALGLALLALVRPETSPLDVVRDIVLIGLGLGCVQPLYLNAVMSDVPAGVLGVASSQVQFWRNIGGTVGIAILGAIMTSRLAGAVAEQLRAAQLPEGVRDTIVGNMNAGQGLVGPSSLGLPPAVAAQATAAAKLGLAATLHDVFVVAALMTGVALVASLFMRNVPLRSTTVADRRTTAAVPSFGD